jgi:hypothetical protein
MNNKTKWSVNGKKDNTWDIERVVLHEIGHTLGLGHSEDESAIMWAEIVERDTDRTLSDDDVAGIRALYLEWKKLPDAVLNQVSVGSDGTVWGVASGDIYTLIDGQWVGTRGKLTQISVGSSKHVWGTIAGDVYRRY